ncbi:AsnC family transcriptional regulator [Pelotomaculum propionicicum]|uniref:siroheme decarboxylase n=1 Tax=Pelotomaculum propionicicum TaxID=258475 RepID=A0A4Y7RPE4_9FIRM|nr:AsnC family transcriptional regulator [Pelotomaculum propionicicum]TEB10701.1 hypothetical protein Pmgp_02152 [Pelotomaculum propionicicum]
MELDSLDRKLLKIIQADFPLVPEPYRAIGEALEITEDEVIARIKNMVDSGLIRRLGGIFDSRRLGYRGALCAVKTDSDSISQVAAVVNSFSGVTHNYLREHDYNMWFTILAESEEKLEEIISEINKHPLIQEIIVLPAEKIFKIKVNFDLA